jgi:hypothetical protein
MAGPEPTSSPAVPDWLQGAWWRTRVVVDGRVVRRPGPALWIQDGERFVDLRGPGPSALDGPRVMAGTVTWEPPHLRWHHAVDSAGDSGDDVGRLLRRGEQVVVETGTLAAAGGTVPYRERWERLAGQERPSIRLDDRGFVVTADTPLRLELRIDVPDPPPTDVPVGPSPTAPGPGPQAPVPTNPVAENPVPAPPASQEEP